MKHFVVNAVGLIIAILIIPGCSANESDLYEKWENENREKWEQEAESDGYEKGYEEGFKDGEIEERSKYEEKEDQEEKDWDALFEQERKETRDLIRKYADEYDCLVWDDLEDFDFTIDLQNSAVGKKYAEPLYLSISSHSSFVIPYFANFLYKTFFAFSIFFSQSLSTCSRGKYDGKSGINAELSSISNWVSGGRVIFDCCSFSSVLSIIFLPFSNVFLNLLFIQSLIFLINPVSFFIKLLFILFLPFSIV